ncbi:MAG: GNVR domain-containing protein, partial [Gemmatimonadota bacterium]|nr:GNVR domain-containing protein [Gemmatimonadota bacterium]
EMLGMLQAERESKSIQLKIKQTIYTPRHPEVNLLKKEIIELDRSIRKIQQELTDYSALEDPQLTIPVSDIPGISLAYTRLYRSVKVQEELFLLMSAQLEEARISELDDTPTAIVLDPAVTPEYKCRPKRLLNVLITTAAALVLGILYLVAWQRVAGSRLG